MKQILKKYGVELLIILISLLLGLIEAIVIKDTNLQVIIVAIGFLLALTTLAIRREISDQISEQFEFYRLARKIANEYWRTQALEELEQFRYKLQQWADGNRFISVKDSVQYQIKLLKRTERSIDAIHVGLSEGSLLLWTRQHGAFSRLIEAHKGLNESIRKRRIFVFDDVLLSAQRKIEDLRVLDICKQQIRKTSEGGLEVDLRILWRSTIDRTQNHIPPDLLLADGTEAVVVTGTGGNHMEVKALVNPTQVRMYVSLFERYWDISEPVSYYLD